MAINPEKEITQPVQLCNHQGNLNREAVGWSRHPLHNCNLKGHWSRKKQWNWWGVNDSEVYLSTTVAHMDFAALGAAMVVDLNEKRHYGKEVITPLGREVVMPPTVRATASFAEGGLSVVYEHTGDHLYLTAACPDLKGHPFHARITIAFPKDHETLNVVIPWNDRQFQFTSKQNCLPAEGVVCYQGKTHVFKKGSSFAVHDFGRGVWPYETRWNWATGTGKSGEHRLGLQMGGKWTDGTGMTENSLTVDGRLFKWHEDLQWDYDRHDFMAPWRILAPETGVADLTFTPVHEVKNRVDLALVRSELHVLYGHFNGKVKAGDKTFIVKNFGGWAEEHLARW